MATAIQSLLSQYWENLTNAPVKIYRNILLQYSIKLCYYN